LDEELHYYIKHAKLHNKIHPNNITSVSTQDCKQQHHTLKIIAHN